MCYVCMTDRRSFPSTMVSFILYIKDAIVLVNLLNMYGIVYNLITVLQLQTLQGKVTQGYSSMLAYVTIL